MYAGLFLLLGTAAVGVVLLVTRSSLPIQVRTASPTSGPPAVRVVPPPQVLDQVRNGIAAAQHSADLGRLVTTSWVVLAVTTVGAALLGWFAAGRVLRPLRAMAATARTISAGSLHQRLALTGPEDEFKQLGDTLDQLFGRLEASFEAQRHFVANASHELRTPMTLQRTLLQVALANPNATADELRSTCHELLASQNDQERLLEALLTLASSERGLDRREPVYLPAVVESALRAKRPEAERRGLTVETTLGAASTVGDPALIARLAANLLDNAVEYNVAGGAVQIQTGVRGEYAELTVGNTGRPLSDDDIGRLFEPFQRLDGERTRADGHHGLGLSIVRAIAAAHGADATARARPDGGLDVTVRFRGYTAENVVLSAGPDASV